MCRGVKVNKSCITCTRALAGPSTPGAIDRSKFLRYSRATPGHRSYDRSAATLYAGYQIEVRNCRNIDGLPAPKPRNLPAVASRDNRQANPRPEGERLVVNLQMCLIAVNAQLYIDLIDDTCTGGFPGRVIIKFIPRGFGASLASRISGFNATTVYSPRSSILRRSVIVLCTLDCDRRHVYESL